ncbi:MAG: translesion DNA synthesis-associated protein ImuA [Pseudomonadota bacterium]
MSGDHRHGPPASNSRDDPGAGEPDSPEQPVITPASSSGVFFSPQTAEPHETERASGAQRPELDAAFAAAGLWRANSLTQTQASVCPTGYAALDACLPGGGWPVAGLTELLTGHAGVGELRLLMPALAAMAAAQSGWVVWIGPPYMPNAPALLQWGLPPERMLVIHPRSPADAAWAAEQALASGTCIAVLLWTQMLEQGRGFVTGQRRARLSMQQFSRRLQVAASTHHCWAVALRGVAARRQPSAAVLRLYLAVREGQRDVHLLKVRGGYPGVVEHFDAGIDIGAAMVREPASAPHTDATPNATQR